MASTVDHIQRGESFERPLSVANGVHSAMAVRGEANEERSLHIAPLRSGRQGVGYDAGVDTNRLKQEHSWNAKGDGRGSRNRVRPHRSGPPVMINGIGSPRSGWGSAGFGAGPIFHGAHVR